MRVLQFVEVMRKGRYDVAYYLLPYIYIHEAAISPVLSLKNRLAFLEAAFSIFLEHYNSILNAPNTDLFQQLFHSNCIGIYFDIIFLKRVMNTIVGIAAALINIKTLLLIQRLSTHDSELFFGYMKFIRLFQSKLHICNNFLLKFQAQQTLWNLSTVILIHMLQDEITFFTQFLN